MTNTIQTYPEEGRLFVVSAPSGGGKTTLLRRLIDIDPNCFFSVSHTTRLPREGERDAEDYYFVNHEEFDRLQAKGAFLEWAEVHGNCYGTSSTSVSGLVQTHPEGGIG